jgi:type II restriction/modification system DNA methylase subunit YeeA
LALIRAEQRDLLEVGYAKSVLEVFLDVVKVLCQIRFLRRIDVGENHQEYLFPLRILAENMRLDGRDRDLRGFERLLNDAFGKEE